MARVERDTEVDFLLVRYRVGDERVPANVVSSVAAALLSVSAVDEALVAVAALRDVYHAAVDAALGVLHTAAARAVFVATAARTAVVGQRLALAQQLALALAQKLALAQ